MAEILGTSERSSNAIAKYSDAYIESCFLVWYKHGRPPINTVRELLQPDELGRIPAYHLIGGWRDRYQWDQRADVLDVEVQTQIQKQAIQQKVEMLNRHAEAGALMVSKAVEYLKTHELTKMPDAIRMLVQGVEIEQASRGLPSALIKISEMNDENLNDTVTRLLSKMNPDEAVKLAGEAGKALPDKDAVEGEFADAD